jgi:mono/diheme cytochrome c family protein
MTSHLRHRLLAALAACLVCARASAADSTVYAVVPGFERFHAGKADARGGQILLTELSCVACHQADGGSASRRQAPVLDQVASRVRVGHLRKFLHDPQAVKPGTAMPDLLGAGPERDRKVEALTHFLASTGAVKHERPDGKSAAAGRDLYHKVGCVACHGPRDAAGNPDKAMPSSVPLGDLKSKYTIATLAAFLDNPHAARPSGRMPKLLTGEEPKDVANYLLQGIKAVPPQGRGAAVFAYYEGNWDRLPDFDKLKPADKGTGPAFDLALARRGENFGLKFEGFFKVERDGEYTFSLTSDDGSRLSVDGKVVVDNDGTHPPQTKQGRAKLSKGAHKVVVTFFQAGGGAELAVDVEAPGLGHRGLGELVAPTEADLDRKPVVEAPQDEDYIDIQPALVEKGKALFASVGCANCHQMTADKKPLAPTLTAPTLAKLRPAGGCLAPEPAKGLPRFALSGAQRDALAAALKAPPAPAKAHAEVIAQTMTAFNCYACHSRDKVGGPEEAVNKLFQTTQPEMGDEARVPPPLDGVGAKLTPEYFKQVLDKGAHDRPYMHTRMPGFGDANVGHLVAAFGAIDTLPKAPAVTFDMPAGRVKAAARHLVGGQAFGCVKCHTFNGVKAEGTQGIDMTLMPRRLKRDWFFAYVENPQVIRPGTRMPSAFINGKSLLDEVMGGQASLQIEAMWLYLSDGPKAQLPAGMGKQSIPLVPTSGAILYRNFIEGAGARGFAVGYPEKAHLAFDANDMRLALLWQGAFLDAARHWTDRGVGYEGPLGDNILHLHAGAPFAELPKPDAPWPATPARAQGYRFLGYTLTADDRPTFRYAFGDVKVEDFPNAVAGKEPSVRRVLKLTAPRPVENLYCRAAVGTKVEALGGGWYRIDGTWKLKIDSAAAPVVRSSGGKQELLVPLRFADGKAEVTQELVW